MWMGFELSIKPYVAGFRNVWLGGRPAVSADRAYWHDVCTYVISLFSFHLRLSDSTGVPQGSRENVMRGMGLRCTSTARSNLESILQFEIKFCPFLRPIRVPCHTMWQPVRRSVSCRYFKLLSSSSPAMSSANFLWKISPIFYTKSQALKMHYSSIKWLREIVGNWKVLFWAIADIGAPKMPRLGDILRNTLFDSWRQKSLTLRLFSSTSP